MAKSSKLSDNIPSNTHIITELFHAENEQQSNKSDNEKEKNDNNKKENDSKKKESLFQERDYILEIDDRHESISKENFLKYLEYIVKNFVDINNYNLSNFKGQNKNFLDTIEKRQENKNKESKHDIDEINDQEKDINFTGNFLDIDV